MSTRTDPGTISVTANVENVRLVASSPTVGNVGQAGTWNVVLVASTASIGTVTTAGAGSNVSQAGTWYMVPIASTATIGTVTTSVNAATVTQGGPFDIRLIASTTTIGGVNALLVASTATVGTVTTSSQRAQVISAPTVMTTGLFASPTLAVNLNRKSMWFQNVSGTAVYLGFGANTPTSTLYHLALASTTVPHGGRGGVYFDNEWVGAVYAISDVASGTVVFAETT